MDAFGIGWARGAGGAIRSDLDRHVRDPIEETADRLIDRYRDALKDEAASWTACREGLRLFTDDLEALHAAHPALARLRSFIDQQDRKFAH